MSCLDRIIYDKMELENRIKELLAEFETKYKGLKIKTISLDRATYIGDNHSQIINVTIDVAVEA